MNIKKAIQEAVEEGMEVWKKGRKAGNGGDVVVE